MKLQFQQLPADAQEVLGQLFLFGPCYDGGIASKHGRDILFENALIERGDGWQWLTRAGVELSLEADVRNRADQRWHKKQCL